MCYLVYIERIKVRKSTDNFTRLILLEKEINIIKSQLRVIGSKINTQSQFRSHDDYSNSTSMSPGVFTRKRCR